MKYKTWRLIHRYSFGTWKWFMILTSIILIIISITGIVLIHEHDTNFFFRVKVSTAILPSQYEEKIDNIRAAQGSAKAHFNKEAKSVPLSWLMYDLHSGEFFGKWTWIYYDLISLALIVYSVSGIVMFVVLRNTHKNQLKKGKLK
jgi:hypothetical protein